MHDIRTLIESSSHLINVGILCSIISFGLTEAVKLFFKDLKKSKKHPWWYQGGLRLFSMGTGALAGWVLAGYPVGLIAGCAGGTLSAVIVRGIKEWIRQNSGKKK